MLSVGANMVQRRGRGAWGGPRVSARGEAVVAPSAHLPFLIVVEIFTVSVLHTHLHVLDTCLASPPTTLAT
jgi:hypothetical protein